MKIFSLFSFIIFLLVSLFQTDVVAGNSAWIPRGKPQETKNPIATVEPEPPIKATKCPSSSTIEPCTCSIPPLLGGVFVACSGSAVNQKNIENAFTQLRSANGVPQDRVLHFREFNLDSTNLTRLDFVPFYGTKMDFLFIQFNYELTKLVTSGNPQDLSSIHVASFNLQSSPLKREGLGDTLKYFSNELVRFSARDLQLNEKDLNQDESDQDESELLPGLSGHKNLEQLTLSNCNLGQLKAERWNFRRMSSIIHITLDDDNMDAIGENVFRLDDLEVGELGYLHIDLANNRLNETSFHPNSGIAPTPSDRNRRASIYLRNNQITTLPAEIFQSFLDAKLDNSIELEGNPLICDERLSWIKARREEFQFLVKDAYCSNDPGHTVFDSHLIP